MCRRVIMLDPDENLIFLKNYLEYTKKFSEMFEKYYYEENWPIFSEQIILNSFVEVIRNTCRRSIYLLDTHFKESKIFNYREMFMMMFNKINLLLNTPPPSIENDEYRYTPESVLICNNFMSFLDTWAKFIENSPHSMICGHDALYMKELYTCLDFFHVEMLGLCKKDLNIPVAV